ncbi:MAG: AcrR family transcriptional regulator [Burkholderiaceae bacterium]|jgi:AcrR family transcriptional regulator
MSDEIEITKNNPITDKTAPLTGRALILDTAATLFRNKGFAATSLRDIATTANMKAGSLYYYFESKDAIVAEVLRIGVAHVFDQVKISVDALGANASSRELIGTAVSAHLNALLHTQNFTSANIRIFGQVSDEIKRNHIPLRKEYEQFWAELLNRCNRDLNQKRNLHLVRFFIIGAMNATLEWFQPGKASISDIASELTALLLDGVLKKE